MTKNNQVQFKQTSVSEIPKDWEKFKLGNLINIKHGYAFSGKHFSNKPTSNILLTPGNFKIGGGFNKNKFKYFNGDIPHDYILKKDDLIVTMTDLSKTGDTLGYSALVPESKNKKYLHNQRIGLVIIKSEKISKKYLYWLMRSQKYRTKILGSATGTTVKHTAPKRIESFELFIPPFLEQQKIAEVLGSLDDKIEMLEKQNRTLESLGQTIFKKWFIDSDEEENSTFKEIAKIVTGKRPNSKSSNKTDEFNIPIIGAGGIMGYTNETMYDENIIVTGRVGTHGILQRIDDSCWTSDNTLVTISDYPNFTYYIMKTIDFHSLNRGSTQPLITQTDLQNYPIYLPEKNEIDKFETIAEILFEKISLNGNMIYNLSQIRDLLLTKLMSGKVRVR